MREEQEERAMQTITIPASVLQHMETAKEELVQEHEKLQKEYRIICKQVKQYVQHVKSKEP